MQPKLDVPAERIEFTASVSFAQLNITNRHCSKFSELDHTYILCNIYSQCKGENKNEIYTIY
jgi:hypothetical protein